jgi:hypothetical protein
LGLLDSKEKGKVYTVANLQPKGAVVATDPAGLRPPHDASEGKELLSRVFNVPPGELAALFEMNESQLDALLQAVLAASASRNEFIINAIGRATVNTLRRRYAFDAINNIVKDVQQSGRPDMETILSSIRRIIRHEENEDELGAVEALGKVIPMAKQIDDLTALGREVSRLSAKVNILLYVTGGSALAIIAGSIALWQEIGGVETRLTRELGQVETRITQQIADVRSEVGEIRGRLSVLGPAPTPPQQ